ncbi:MAG TPA: hypothetical protein VL325_09340 [Pyrinomonadaceae bacterium]|nr:hypothetical protein [Pyrinomonadaceae bacterium]
MAKSNSTTARLIGRRFIFFLLLLGAIVAFAPAQDLPSKIRGYKLHKKPISVTNSKGPTGDLKIGVPSVTNVSISGVKFAVTVAIDKVPETGRVDFLTFNDFKINGIPVTIDEYTESFRFNKGQAVSLSEPLGVSIGTAELFGAARKEVDRFRGEWTVTGRVFVFGKFRKYGMEFRRVVPVDIDLKIKNPLASG